ncbi:hypothetical protein AC1031_004998 [Aphanomyces cochlioides]|nr:hypothetical protein AC1031_004998 [Aphanomyces cochlioides]
MHSNATLQAVGLPPKYAAELAKVAKKNAQVLLASSTPQSPSSPIEWTQLGTPIDGVQLYTGTDPRHSKTLPPLNYMCGVAYVHAPLENVAFSFSTAARNPYFKRFVEDPIVIDSRTLFDMDVRARRATSIQWMAVRSVSSLMQHRDFVVVQHQDDIPEQLGQPRGWMSCMHSVNLPMVPPFENSYVRGGIYSSGFVFRETKQRNVTEAVIVLQVDFKGLAPRLLCTSTLKAWASSVGRVSLYFYHHRRLAPTNQSNFLPPSGASADARTGCAVCNEPFGYQTEKETCRKCLAKVCSHCTAWAYVDLEVVGLINVLVCKPCAAEAEARLRASFKDDSEELSSLPVDLAQIDRLVLPKTAPSPQSFDAMEHEDEALPWGPAPTSPPASPVYTDEIPMRLSAVTWMDTLTKIDKADQPPPPPRGQYAPPSPRLEVARFVLGRGAGSATLPSTQTSSAAYLDSADSMFAHAPSVIQSEPDDVDDGASVVKAFTATGSTILDVQCGNVKSFAL